MLERLRLQCFPWRGNLGISAISPRRAASIPVSRTTRQMAFAAHQTGWRNPYAGTCPKSQASRIPISQSSLTVFGLVNLTVAGSR